MQNLIELRHILHAHPELSGQEAKVQNPASASSSVATLTLCTSPSRTIFPTAHKTKAFRTNAATMAIQPSSAAWPNGSVNNAPTKAKWCCSSSLPRKPVKVPKPSSATLSLSESNPMWLTGCTTFPASKKAKSW